MARTKLPVLFCIQSTQGRTLSSVKSFTKLVACMMLLLISGVQVMACAVPETQMTQEEMACCKQMAGHCGGAGSGSNHPCCEKVVREPQDAVTVQQFAVDRALATSSEPVSVVPLLIPMSAEFRKNVLSGASPPGSPPITSSILRI